MNILFKYNFLWPILFLLWTAFTCYCYTCEVKENYCSARKTYQTAQPVHLSLDQDSLMFDWQFEIRENKLLFQDVQQTKIEQLKQYLLTQQNQQLNVVGKYHPVIENTLAYCDLGQSRANQIHTMLTELGLPDSLLLTTSKPDTNITFYKNCVLNGIELRLQKRIYLTDLEITKYFEKPYNIYFSEGEADLTLDSNSMPYVDFFDKLKYYCLQEPHQKVLLIGYTDNTGNPEYNALLAQKRANYVKTCLLNSGIPSHKITFGANVEASNTNISNQGANQQDTSVHNARRVEIVVNTQASTEAKKATQ